MKDRSPDEFWCKMPDDEIFADHSWHLDTYNGLQIYGSAIVSKFFVVYLHKGEPVILKVLPSLEAAEQWIDTNHDKVFGRQLEFPEIKLAD